MKSDKELFDLFRKNEYGLNQKPSANAWRRLERRLDDHQAQQRHNFRRLFGMVAGLAFIIFIVGLLSVYTQDGSPTPNYHTQYLQPEQDAEMPQTTNLVNLSYQYQEKITKSIPEGNPQKKLVANTDWEQGD